MIFGMGYGNLTPVVFLNILIQNRITMVLDIRAFPDSAWTPAYKAKVLQPMLERLGMRYLSETVLGNESRKKDGFKLTEDAVEVAQFFVNSCNGDNMLFLCGCSKEITCHRGVLFKALRKRHPITALPMEKNLSLDAFG